MEEVGNWGIGGANIILAKTTGSNVEKNGINKDGIFSNASNSLKK